MTSLAVLLPERTTPELLYLKTHWASLVSFGLAAGMLSELLPLERSIGAERARRHVHRVAEREEAELGQDHRASKYRYSRSTTPAPHLIQA